MKIEESAHTVKVECPNCDEFLECPVNAYSAILACGIWAANHICYKRRINIARETSAFNKTVP